MYKLKGTLQSEICLSDEGKAVRKISLPSGNEYLIELHLFLPYSDGTCVVSPKWLHYEKELELAKAVKRGV